MGSILEKIEGVGPKTRQALLRHFGSVRKIQTASIEELKESAGIGPETANTIYNFFAKQNDDNKLN